MRRSTPAASERCCLASWCDIAAVVDPDGIDEMLVQVINVFDDPALQRATDSDIVEHREMLYIFAEPYPAGVRTDRNTKLCRQQQNSQHFVDAANTTGVDLADANGICLKELLEEYAVLHHLAGRDLDWCDRLGNGAWPSTSSGLVGSSIHSRFESTKSCIQSMASRHPRPGWHPA